MPKRRNGELGGGGTAKRRRHLYLAFDDWSSGYSIRKLNLSSDPDSGDAGTTGEQRLPSAVFRSIARRGSPVYFAAAFGTKIMATQPRAAAGVDDEALPLVPNHLVPVLDVRTRGVIFGPRPEADPVQPIYIPVGDRLFALDAGSLEMLYPPPLEEPGGESWVWSWYELSKPPFKRRHVASYAMHPDGRTLFVSTERRQASAATYTFDTEEGSFVWRRHGRCALPFTGEAHFDRELDAWVGLSRDSIGHLCSCNVASPSPDDASRHGQGSGLKLGKEKLFAEDPVDRHVGATLVYMGSRSRFCLVQCVSIEDGSVGEMDACKLEGKDLPRHSRFLYRLTTFSLKYDKNGDLTTGDTIQLQYYKVPRESTEFLLSSPVAFWM